MNISSVHIRNFRKLKDCRIDIATNQTLFVGANNSGKTSAMDALILFLKLRKGFSTRDFTLSNWHDIDKIGESWIRQTEKEIDLSFSPWKDSVPSLDIWLNIKSYELHYIHHLIPTLDWKTGLLGIRIRFEPDNIEKLCRDFTEGFNVARRLENPPIQDDKFKIWPKSLWAFLDEKGNLNSYFKLKTYLLDPDQYASFQELPSSIEELKGDPLAGLIKVDIINAQRGFSDINTEGESISGFKNLSNQLRSYYDRHLNPTISPTENDVKALNAINETKRIFDENVNTNFQAPLSELAMLNYPGFGNPKITLSTKFSSLDGLNHESAVLYSLGDNLSLPERYNGLGYQNLISIIFKLIRFRDEWMQVGKIAKIGPSDSDTYYFEPLHLVLIEEPEAHLHAQVQQVFIRKAYEVLRTHINLGKDSKFETQLIISTHSNHIAHETDFSSLRYFKRQRSSAIEMTTSTVINLSETFGTDDETTRFTIRYLKTTHCDLFFADAVILVEGPAERMLIPYFIKNHTLLYNCYLSILEIGGSHAHRLRPLIEKLGLITLIITDLDTVNGTTKCQPEKGKGYKSGNDTIKNWIPGIEDFDELITLSFDQKQFEDLPIRVAYQTTISTKRENSTEEVYPYTFEDSLVMTNRNLFKELHKSSGLLNKMVEAAQQEDTKISAKLLYEAITQKNAKKAEFALELFFFEHPKTLKTPTYIEEGLSWLEKLLLPAETPKNISTKSK